ncbi:MAG: hypothetical protein KBT04_02760 [Bacteroidales bacterium]|nr:hypothetical protein [Candidatus Colimorpha onthohippi]
MSASGNNKKWLIKLLKNKYVITILIFAVLAIFVTDNNLIVLGRLSRQVNELHKVETDLIEATIRDSIQYNQLYGNMEALEHFGREVYFLKRADEDVYVFQEN